ncbi:MAG: CPBP family intramembrane metalloprotease [Ideonella sp.]|nr:CPBP family intramembrane metalloprotease [Ideonella sp.]MCC7456724.1 CPBP family intramembrane metalloprotease [Nitrospira sp.]
MNLVLSLVLLALAQGLLLTQIAAPSFHASAGLASIMGLQLLALWKFRTSLPAATLSAVRLPPALATAALCSVGVFAFGLLIGALANSVLGVDFAASMTLLRPFVGDGIGILAVCGLAPLVEEIVFRSAAIELLASRFARSVAMVLAAIAFGFVHASFDAQVFAALLGIALGISYLVTRSIVPGYVAHAALNVCSVVWMHKG